jgi:hypothetical protein
VNVTFRRLYPQGKAVRYLLNRRMDGAPELVWMIWRRGKIIAVPGIKPLLLGHPAYAGRTVVTIPTMLLQLPPVTGIINLRRVI